MLKKKQMHELRIAQELSAIIAVHAREAGLTTIEKVNLCFGEFIQVVPEVFETAFRASTENSSAADAELVIEIIPAEMRCTACGTEYLPSQDRHECMRCGSSEITIIHGKELFIKSIEGE